MIHSRIYVVPRPPVLCINNRDSGEIPDFAVGSSVGLVELGDGVEFGDLEGEEVEGRDAGIEGDKDDDDGKEGAKDAAAYAAAAAPAVLWGGGKKGEIGFPRWWFEYKSARLMWVSISRRFLEHASFMRDCFHRVMSKVFFVALRPETAIFSSLRSM
ncbi:hypothetical protein DVH24_039000 [Malus domestica]|uniref:Uncharacterized protein n=1 Tax=Malus domestica TaxID=3750 RepID=A0A498KBJ0_MALDO|nr:hypothetical protein DVH24_039000 [Malus domestica]